MNANLHDKISFAEAARRLPRNGPKRKRICVSTIWRWHHKGVRGVRLQAWRYGLRYYTTMDALNEFARQLAEASAAPMGAGPVSVTPRPARKATRAARIETARRQLESAGI